MRLAGARETALPSLWGAQWGWIWKWGAAHWLGGVFVGGLWDGRVWNVGWDGMGWGGFVGARLKERMENALSPSGDVIRLRSQVFPPDISSFGARLRRRRREMAQEAHSAIRFREGGAGVVVDNKAAETA